MYMDSNPLTISIALVDVQAQPCKWPPTGSKFSPLSISNGPLSTVLLVYTITLLSLSPLALQNIGGYCLALKSTLLCQFE